MTHTQAHFCHETLGSKIKLKQKCQIELLEEENWPANNESLEKCGKVAQDRLGTADLLICFGFHSPDAIPPPQFGGVSYVGSVCNTALRKDFKCQLNMWWDDPSTTAAVSIFTFKNKQKTGLPNPDPSYSIRLLLMNLVIVWGCTTILTPLMMPLDVTKRD